MKSTDLFFRKKVYLLLISILLVVFSFVSLPDVLPIPFDINLSGTLFQLVLFLVGWLMYLFYAFAILFLELRSGIRISITKILAFTLVQIAISITIGGLRIFSPFTMMVSLFIMILSVVLMMILLLIRDYYQMSHRRRGVTFLFLFKVVFSFSLFFLILSNFFNGNLSFYFLNPDLFLFRNAYISKAVEMEAEDMKALPDLINTLEIDVMDFKLLLSDEEGDFSGYSLTKKEEIREKWEDIHSGLSELQAIYKRQSSAYASSLFFRNKFDQVRYLMSISSLLAFNLNAFRIIDTVNAIPSLRVFLNENDSETGLSRNSFFRIKQWVYATKNLSDLKSGLDYFYNDFSVSDIPGQEKIQSNAESDIRMTDTEKRLKQLNNYIRNSYIYTQNIINMKQDDVFRSSVLPFSREMIDFMWSPVQKGVLKIITGVEFTPRMEKFIDDTLYNEIAKSLKPGDILLKRSNWQLTNLGIPGFWTHSAIYLGNFDKLDAYFKETAGFKDEPFSQYVKRNFPGIFERINNHSDCIIEVIAPGVVISPLENIAKVDYFAALRPKLSRSDIVKALLASFEYYRQGYDYSFNFLTENELVCSELIYKSYLEDKEIDKKGLHFELKTIKEKPLLTVNAIAEKYDKDLLNDNQELELVLFVDADEKKKKAFVSDKKAFREIWKQNNLEF